MQNIAQNPATDLVQAPESISEQLGSVVALAILLVVFVTFDLFHDHGDSKMLEVSSGNETLTYLTAFFLVGLSGVILHQRGALALSALVTRENVLLLAWLVGSVAWSTSPSTSARRLILTCATFLLAAMLPWLTKGLRHFSSLLLITAATALVLSYLGIILVPHLTIHQATDLVEPGLAGDWRGIYSHKNVTAPVMATFAFVGWFVFRAGRPWAGILLSIAAVVFLMFSGGKSAMGLVVAACVAAWLVARARSFWMKASVAFGSLALLGFLTVGSLVSDLARSLLALLPIDPTFTRRTDVWQFALDAISANPWKGRGFEAFWYSEAALYGSDDPTQWAGSAHTSHNGFIDLALTIGFPGLALVILVLVVRPLRDFHHTLENRANRDLACLFLVLWLFSLYLGMFEAFFLSRIDTMWFVCAMAVCGLRYTSQYVVRS